MKVRHKNCVRIVYLIILLQEFQKAYFKIDLSLFIITAYFNNPELRNKNIISVDWEKAAGHLNYFWSAQNTVIVGQYAGRVLGEILVNDLGADPKLMHAWGFSLGGHFVGHLGRKLTETDRLKRKMARITGT